MSALAIASTRPVRTDPRTWREANRAYFDGLYGRASAPSAAMVEYVDALIGCIEHMEWSTPHGQAAYDRACDLVARATPTPNEVRS